MCLRTRIFGPYRNSGNEFAWEWQNIYPMYSQIECLSEIERHIPELSNVLHKPDCEKSIYKQIIILSEYTAERLYKDELNEVERLFQLAENLYQNGNGMVKSAIENVFVYALTSLLGNRKDSRKKLISLLPMTLFTIYMNQVLHRGC